MKIYLDACHGLLQEITPIVIRLEMVGRSQNVRDVAVSYRVVLWYYTYVAGHKQ